MSPAKALIFFSNKKATTTQAQAGVDDTVWLSPVKAKQEIEKLQDFQVIYTKAGPFSPSFQKSYIVEQQVPDEYIPFLILHSVSINKANGNFRAYLRFMLPGVNNYIGILGDSSSSGPSFAGQLDFDYSANKLLYGFYATSSGLTNCYLDGVALCMKKSLTA